MKERTCNDTLTTKSIFSTDKYYGKTPNTYSYIYYDILEPIKVIEKPKSKFHK